MLMAEQSQIIRKTQSDNGRMNSCMLMNNFPQDDSRSEETNLKR